MQTTRSTFRLCYGTLAALDRIAQLWPERSAVDADNQRRPWTRTTVIEELAKHEVRRLERRKRV